MARRWSLPANDEAAISTPEKKEFRNHIIGVIVTSPVAIRPQLANVLNNVLGVDFPQEWPEFLDNTVKLLKEPSVESVYAGLLCLLELSRVYRWRSKDRRKGLDTIIQASFPILLHIGGGLVDEESSLAGDMMRIIFKVYKSITWLELSSELQNMSSLVPWGQLFLKVITKVPPTEAMVGDLDAREAHAWWRAKKWAYFSLDRLFQRYGDPTQLGSETAEDYGEFARLFTAHFAPEIMKCYLGQVQNWSTDPKTHWLSPRSLYFISSFLTSCVKPKSTWALLKDNFDSLVEHFVFPQICQTADDLDLWEADPQEYINKRIDIYDDYSSPDVAAINFLVACCSRKKTTCFIHTLEFVNKELNFYQQAPEAQKNPIRKEAALRMIGTLSHLILREKSPVKPMMEQFFASHVFPEFNSPVGYLRARACEMMNRFADIEFQDQQNLAIAYEGVMKCLMERELPVRVEAALALQPLISQDFVHNAMVQSIPKIMKVLLQLANEVDVDSLSNVMEEFVEVFASELTPYAVELAEQLRDTFLRIMQDSADNQGLAAEDNFEWDNMDDKSLAALGILNTLGTLILSLENTPEALFKLEETVLPVIHFVLSNEIIDLYAEAFEIIDSCTFSAKVITPTMWGVFETVHKAFKDSGMDYMDEILPSLDNYVTFGADKIAQTPTYQAVIFDIIYTVFTNDRLGVQDRLAATKLAQIFLLNLKGHIDQYLHPIMNLVFQRLSDPKEHKMKLYRTLLLETLVNALYYNPRAGLEYLESNNGVAPFFSLWLSSLDQFVRVHDKKLVILAIIALLSLPVDQIPASVQQDWAQLSTAMIAVFKTLPAALKRREDAQQRLTQDNSEFGQTSGSHDDTEEDWDEDGLDEFPDEDQDAPDTAGQAYLDFLGKEATRLSNPTSTGDGDEYGDDNDEDDQVVDDAMAEDVLFVSPLDKYDTYIMAKTFFHGLHEANPALYEQYTSGWDADTQAEFQSVMTIANTNETLLAAKGMM